jgi:hypothetical protein
VRAIVTPFVSADALASTDQEPGNQRNGVCLPSFRPPFCQFKKENYAVLVADKA